MEFGVALFQDGDNSPLAGYSIGDTTHYTEREAHCMQLAVEAVAMALIKGGYLKPDMYLSLYHDQNPQWKR